MLKRKNNTKKMNNKPEFAIEADKLTKSFGSKTVVDEVSFSIKRGEIFGFLGPNGSGKSTVIRMLCGLINPTKGQGFINGINVTENAELIRKSIGYMSQKFGLYPDLTVEQNLNFYGQIYGVPDHKLKDRKAELCGQIGLNPYMQNKADQLSGGWKQRLALACSLLHKPSVLFLDEPTAGIDPVARREVWDLLFDLSTDGMTMLVTTHYMDEAERCNRIGYIYLSKMIAIGSIKELIDSPELRNLNSYQVSIQGEPSMAIYAYLRSLDYLKDITIFGRNLHATLPNNLSIESLKNLIIENTKCENLSIKSSEPSLEDIFVILTKKQKANQ